VPLQLLEVKELRSDPSLLHFWWVVDVAAVYFDGLEGAGSTRKLLPGSCERSFLEDC
jgi:hypothetical protein